MFMLVSLGVRLPSRLAEPAPHGMPWHARRSCFSHARRPVRHSIKGVLPLRVSTRVNDPPSSRVAVKGTHCSNTLFLVRVISLRFILGKIGMLHIFEQRV